VTEESFLSRQDLAIHECRQSFSESSKLFGLHGLGVSFRLASLLVNLTAHLRFDIWSDSSSKGLRHHLVEDSIHCASTHALCSIKHRAHIPVPGSFTLLGVSNCLREGEIYATIFYERTGVSQPVVGRVLISRSPQVHPGDLQYVTAVCRPELDHLKNVVVFSCQGERSLPSCLTGGDLDGDDYNLILEPAPHPHQSTSKPSEYTNAKIKTTSSPCTIADVADSVINCIKSDLLSYISILHLWIA